MVVLMEYFLSITTTGSGKGCFRACCWLYVFTVCKLNAKV